MESRCARLKRGLETLTGLAVLEHSLAGAAAEIAAAHAPAACALGFVYGDLCPDNIVLRASGEVCIVDNETLSIEPCDYDVGRTWYRWPMERRDRETFFAGYLEHRPLTTFFTHFPYWAVTAIVDGALFRSRRGGVAAAAAPAQRLETLVRELERGMPAEDAVFLC
jgi:Ser/Thr protein kinase RdoA (MazF antagonist)